MCEADYKLVAKAIRHQVTAIKRQREKQHRLLEGAPNRQGDTIGEEPDPVRQPPEPSNHKPAPSTSKSAEGKVANQVCLSLLPWLLDRTSTSC